MATHENEPIRTGVHTRKKDAYDELAHLLAARYHIRLRSYDLQGNWMRPWTFLCRVYRAQPDRLDGGHLIWREFGYDETGTKTYALEAIPQIGSRAARSAPEVRPSRSDSRLVQQTSRRGGGGGGRTNAARSTSSPPSWMNDLPSNEFERILDQVREELLRQSFEDLLLEPASEADLNSSPHPRLDANTDANADADAAADERTSTLVARRATSHSQPQRLHHASAGSPSSTHTYSRSTSPTPSLTPSERETVGSINALFSHLSSTPSLKLRTLRAILRALDEPAEKIPESVTQCRAALSRIHVNIWDLVPALRCVLARGEDEGEEHGEGGYKYGVPRYKLHELCHELVQVPRRRFPLQRAKSALLRDLLRLAMGGAGGGQF
ncbi:hypothetical protein OC842_005053 [Tilletia horrida]|uniref:Uncharacterized protein n=1 Tax=Tilletia horrida TaxID=155126 RepID=A0AAN6G8I1_9BASI|nr:hypothetical protein OC842_005053 [Tilletia horrida]